MILAEKNTYKDTFKKALLQFVEQLKDYVATDSGEWSVKGFIDVYRNIYTISSDTKIISKVLEIHIFPRIIQFAKANNYKIVLTEHQNYYPDLTFVHKKHEEIKFAVDLKTTYRKKNDMVSFTLGSHGGYFKERNKKKNIQYPYNQYIAHFCLGIVYSRTDRKDETKVYNANKLQSITSVIKDFDFFVAEKWKIASDKQGSGNTANIGCSLSIDDLRNERGIFSQLGEKWFDEYWINFGVATMVKDGKTVKITNLKDFLTFKERKDLFDKINK